MKVYYKDIQGEPWDTLAEEEDPKFIPKEGGTVLIDCKESELKYKSFTVDSLTYKPGEAVFVFLKKKGA